MSTFLIAVVVGLLAITFCGAVYVLFRDIKTKSETY